VDIQHSAVEDDIVVVALCGRLDLKAAAPVQGALLKHLAEQPAGVIVDLAGVEAIDPICAAVFSAVTYPAGRWQGTNLVLCRPRPPVATVLNSVAVPRFLPVCDTLDQALSSALARPAWLRETFWFDPEEDGGERLGLVRRYALAAGTRPDPEGGSTAWCVLPVGPPPSAS
jgi:anti-anti-sigma factor